MFSDSWSKYLKVTSRNSWNKVFTLLLHHNHSSHAHVQHKENPMCSKSSVIYLLSKPETSPLAGNPTGILLCSGGFISCTAAAACQGNHLRVTSNFPWLDSWAQRTGKSATGRNDTGTSRLTFFFTACLFNLYLVSLCCAPAAPAAPVGPVAEAAHVVDYFSSPLCWGNIFAETEHSNLLPLKLASFLFWQNETVWVIVPNLPVVCFPFDLAPVWQLRKLSKMFLALSEGK